MQRMKLTLHLQNRHIHKRTPQSQFFLNAALLYDVEDTQIRFICNKSYQKEGETGRRVMFYKNLHKNLHVHAGFNTTEQQLLGKLWLGAGAVYVFL